MAEGAKQQGKRIEKMITKQRPEIDNRDHDEEKR